MSALTGAPNQKGFRFDDPVNSLVASGVLAPTDALTSSQAAPSVAQKAPTLTDQQSLRLQQSTNPGRASQILTSPTGLLGQPGEEEKKRKRLLGD